MGFFSQLGSRISIGKAEETKPVPSRLASLERHISRVTNWRAWAEILQAIRCGGCMICGKSKKEPVVIELVDEYLVFRIICHLAKRVVEKWVR
jgi:hypothetical protein